MAKKELYFIIHKPYKILSQFSDEGSNKGLGAIFDLPKDVYPVGRLDLDSEGLLILTNDKSLNQALLHPKNQHQRTYWVQVDGAPSTKALEQLAEGVTINLNGKPYRTQKAQAAIIYPKVPERLPPINHQKHPVTTWLSISLTEGKNRQVRRMTAKVGHPTLRLIRVGIEGVGLSPLQSGEITQLSKKVIKKKLRLHIGG